MKEILKSKKIIIYVLIGLIIIAGIVSVFVGKFNYTLMYNEHKQINVYLGKTYNLQDIKNIAEETLGTKEIVYREIETFHDSIAINVSDASEEQINTLEAKLKEKYEITQSEKIIQTTNVAHLKGIDIIEPYIVRVVIATILVLVYVAIRYFKLGVLKTIPTMLLRIILAEALLLSVISIFRLPIGAWTMPIAILLYMLVIICTTVQFENTIQKSTEKVRK